MRDAAMAGNEALEKCTRLLALTVARKQKFPSSPLRVSPYIAENVTRSTDDSEIT
jgi:hypothetical protein